MKENNILVFIDDILESMNRIQTYLSNHTIETFSDNNMAFDAVVRNLEIIGEAAKNIPDDIRDRYDNVPWQRMVGLRNVLIHEYFGIDKEIIWKIASEHLPEIKPQIEKLAKEI